MDPASSSSLSSKRKWHSDSSNDEPYCKKPKNDVFLNYSFEYIGNSFIRHLKGAFDRNSYTISDNTMVPVGREVRSELLKAIHESEIFVVVFSRNYASSVRCLDELVDIMDCLPKFDDRKVFPIFYKVEPSDVRSQQGPFMEAFHAHETNVNPESVQTWKKALKEAGLLSGLTLQNGDEAEFLQKIVEEFAMMRSPEELHVTEHPVGIESRTEELISTLRLDCKDHVLVVGVSGISGIGKTTIVKEVYNRIAAKFNIRCFLANIHDLCQVPSWKVDLQKVLISCLTRNHKFSIIGNHNDCITEIKRLVSRQMALLVLDDVDNFQQLEALGINPAWFYKSPSDGDDDDDDEEETATKSPSALRVDSSHGSRSPGGASPKIHDDDTTITSSYIPQLVDEDNYQLPLQMENQELLEGGFLNMLLSMGQQQTATNAPVRVPEPEPIPVPKLIPKTKHIPVPASLLKPVSEPQITIVNGSKYNTWIDHSLEPALEKVRKTTGLIRDMFDQLHRVVGTRHHICTSSPQGMYPKSVENLITYSELLRVFTRDWLDVSVVHSFAMYFFLSPNSKCAFFDPALINGENCESNPKVVIEHIKKIYKYHSNKRYFLAPYNNASDHWTLLIFEPSTASAFVVDSMKKGKNMESYNISKLIAKGFQREFNWTITNCYQQANGWECGFMLIKHMRQFVEIIQHDFIHAVWNTKEITSPEEIDFMVVELMDLWINKVFGGRT